MDTPINIHERKEPAAPFVRSILAYVAGDDRCWSAVVNELSEDLHRFAWQVTGDANLAADATQEAFLHLHASRLKFRIPADGLEVDPAFRAWAAGIVRRCAYALHRKQRRHQNREQAMDHDLTSPQDDAQAQTWGPQELSLLRRELAQLPPWATEVLELRHFGNLSHAEIAIATGCREGTVRMRLHRATKALQTRLRRAGFACSALLLAVGLQSAAHAAEAVRPALAPSLAQKWLSIPDGMLTPSLSHSAVLGGMTIMHKTILALSAALLAASPFVANHLFATENQEPTTVVASDPEDAADERWQAIETIKVEFILNGKAFVIGQGPLLILIDNDSDLPATVVGPVVAKAAGGHLSFADDGKTATVQVDLKSKAKKDTRAAFWGFMNPIRESGIFELRCPVEEVNNWHPVRP